MRVLQINAVANSGSTGRIAEEIGNVLLAHGHDSYIAYGRGNPSSKSRLIKIGNNWDIYNHGIKTVLFDRHGFGSKSATKYLIKQIEVINPDVIGLHNLHGYYINIEVLFSYLKEKELPIVWTLHDCWAFTGHCSHYQNINCEKWQVHCNKCPKTSKYPFSLFDNSFRNFEDKKRLFSNLDIENLRIVVPSEWLKHEVKKSFLKKYETHKIFNGLDLNIFVIKDPPQKIKDLRKNKYVILGVANVWQESKGIFDFLKLRDFLSDEFLIVLIGKNLKKEYQRENLMLIEPTNSIHELADWYNASDIFINPTYLDNFPTTNIEALACGTPVITYDTGGSPEAIDHLTGEVVRKGDIEGLKSAIENLLARNQEQLKADCRERAERLFNKNDRYQDYLNLYESLIDEKRP